jgi:hypothetical protein
MPNVEAFPWDGAPRYMIRDRDRIYGTVVTRRLRAMVSETSQLHPPRLGRTLALHNAPHELIELRPTAEAMEFARFLR